MMPAFSTMRIMHLCGPGSMNDALGYDYALPRTEGDRAVLQVNQKFPFEAKEEFVVVVMFVPVILTLHDSHADDRAINLT